MLADRRRAWMRLKRRPTDGQALGVRAAIGYVRVDDVELAPQREEIRAWCLDHGLQLATVVHDAGRRGEQPSLGWALEQIGTGSAHVLVVARLRDLAVEMSDLPPLLRWFIGPERTLIAIDVGVDTSTEAGRLAACAVAGVVDAGGNGDGGASAAAPRRHGRGAVSDRPELQLRIERMRERGMTLQAIADTLNEEGVPTIRGGLLWRPSSVQRATGYRRPSTQARGIELPKRDPSTH